MLAVKTFFSTSFLMHENVVVRNLRPFSKTSIASAQKSEFARNNGLYAISFLKLTHNLNLNLGKKIDQMAYSLKKQFSGRA